MPVSIRVINARWRLFGHTLRLNENIPARQSMAYYFVKDMPSRKDNCTTAPSALSSEYRDCLGSYIVYRDDYMCSIEPAQDRSRWREIIEKVVSHQYNTYLERVQRRTEARHGAKLEEQATTPYQMQLRKRL